MRPPIGEAVYGAAAFLAPDRLCGVAASPAVDLYALGATLYFLLAGRPPYVGDGDVVARVLVGQATPLEFLVPDLPTAVATLVRRALATAPDTRFPDADAMQQALADARKATGRGPSRVGAVAREVARSWRTTLVPYLRALGSRGRNGVRAIASQGRAGVWWGARPARMVAR